MKLRTKIIRRALAMLLVMAMVCGVLTGCQRQTSEAGSNHAITNTTDGQNTDGTGTNSDANFGTDSSTNSGTDSTAGSNVDSQPGNSSLSATGEYIVKDIDTSHMTAMTNENNARVFYHIFVGSFSDSNGDGVGDLRGIINRMDYLNDGDPDSGCSLGVQGIWLSPIFKSPSYHKYDTTDYYTIDPSFGTMDDLVELVNICHERGVKLILDLVINHTGKDNLWFIKFCQARKECNTDSEYYDFYAVNDSIRLGSRTFSKVSGADCFYECNFSGDMPEPNYDNPFVYDTFVDVARYYLQDIGVDGFRFDAAKYIYYGEEERNAEFWIKYMRDLKAIKPDLYAVAEVWSADSATVRYAPALNCFDFTMAQVDGRISATTKHGDVNGFTFYIESYLDSMQKSVTEAYTQDGYYFLDHEQPSDELLSAFNYSPMLVSFIANHDMDRAAGYMTYASGYAKMAANLLILTPGSPFIYYGEEIGMKGSRGSASTDANRRLAMLWGDGDTVRNPEGTTFDSSKQTNGTVDDMFGSADSLLTHYKRLIMIRRANPEIGSGEFHALKLDGTKAGGFVSIRGDSSVAVFHNTTGSPITIDLNEAKFTDGTPMSSLFNTGNCSIAGIAYASMEYEKTESSLDGTMLTIAEQSSVVLRP